MTVLMQLAAVDLVMENTKGMTGEILSVEQVASLCGVSIDRVRRWIGKRGLTSYSQDQATEGVERDKLINFLLQHNMPLPESIIPFKAKKILFVLASEMFNDLFIQFFMRFFEKIRKEANCIIDYIAYGPNVKMKIMIFKPHLVLLDTAGCGTDATNTARFIKNTDEFSMIKVISLVEKMPLGSNKHDIQNITVDAVVPRCIDIQSLIKKIESLFSQ